MHPENIPFATTIIVAINIDFLIAATSFLSRAVLYHFCPHRRLINHPPIHPKMNGFKARVEHYIDIPLTHKSVENYRNKFLPPPDERTRI